MKFLIIFILITNIVFGQGLPIGNCDESNASINTIFPPNSNTTYTGNSIYQENLFLCGPNTVVYDTLLILGNCRTTYLSSGSKYYFQRGSCSYNNCILAKSNSTLIILPQVSNAILYYEPGAIIINQSISSNINYVNCNSLVFPNVNCNINGLFQIGNESHELEIYPQPSKDFLNLKFDTNVVNEFYDFIIYNNLGEFIKQQTIEINNKQATIRTENLTDGVYFLLLKNKNDVIIKKRFVIVR